jgi:ATP-dependent Zn protease
VDRAQLIDEVQEVVTTLLSEHRQQPDRLSRLLLDDETLGAQPMRGPASRGMTGVVIRGF